MLPFIFELKTLLKRNNRLDSINVLKPRSVHCTFLYPRCSIEDPEIGDGGGVVPLVVNRRHETKTTLNQHAVLILQRFDHHSLHYTWCFNPLSFGFVSPLHTAVLTQLSRLVALVRLRTINTSHHQTSSANELSLELRLTRFCCKDDCVRCVLLWHNLSQSETSVRVTYMRATYL